MERGEILLFTTRTCPNCKAAKELLDRAGICYTPVLAEERPELAEEYGVRQAPTVVLSGAGEPRLMAGLSDIHSMLDAMKQETART